MSESSRWPVDPINSVVSQQQPRGVQIFVPFPCLRPRFEFATCLALARSTLHALLPIEVECIDNRPHSVSSQTTRPATILSSLQGHGECFFYSVDHRNIRLIGNASAPTRIYRQVPLHKLVPLCLPLIEKECYRILPVSISARSTVQVTLQLPTSCMRKDGCFVLGFKGG